MPDRENDARPPRPRSSSLPKIRLLDSSALNFVGEFEQRFEFDVTFSERGNDGREIVEGCRVRRELKQLFSSVFGFQV